MPNWFWSSYKLRTFLACVLHLVRIKPHIHIENGYVTACGYFKLKGGCQSLTVALPLPRPWADSHKNKLIKEKS